MGITFWFFISSGLFLGWSAGANNASNIIGTAVVSKMVRFRTAAIISGIFVILGSVVSGAGTTKTITDLGSVNALAGSFAVAAGVGLSILIMIRTKLLVSASQVIIGGIIGWNFFTDSPTDYNVLYKILVSWVASPVIAGVFGFIIFKIIKKTVLKWKIHLLELDNYTRVGLIIVGALASYFYGANNIANVMGIFVPSVHFPDLNVVNLFVLNSEQQLFLLGGISVAIGMFTYGNKVMDTVNDDFYKISPITGFVVVSAEIIVLWLFTSQRLEQFLIASHLPPIPLVPLSITQAFIGAIIGTGLAKDPHSINFKILGKIISGWAVAPVIAGVITFFSLFFIQNVFEQKIVNPVPYQITESVLNKLNSEGIDTEKIKDLLGQRFDNSRTFLNELKKRYDFNNTQIYSVFNYSLIDSFKIDSSLIYTLPVEYNFTSAEKSFLKELHGKSFNHKIDFEETVFNNFAVWIPTGDKSYDVNISEKKNAIEDLFRIPLNSNKPSK